VGADADYLEIRAALPETSEDALAEVLTDAAILGAEIAPGGNGLIDVSIWTSTGRPGLVAAIEHQLAALGGGGSSVHPRNAEDWAAAWRENLDAFPIGRRWWIEPHPERPSTVPDDRIRLVVEPRAAFGSGTHESTRLVLHQLENLRCAGLTVLDIGTGSGVLAVAADRLGAATVVAIDIDPIATWEARWTARSQPWRCRPMIVAGSLECLGEETFDLVLCNMIAAEFEPLLPGVAERLDDDGMLVLSGILDDQRQRVETMLDGAGMVIDGGLTIGEWVSLCARRRGRVR
jgi:ribosomal protein L11 methyltransferase